MINQKYTIKLHLLLSTKRMIRNGIQVDLSEFNAVQREWLVNNK